MVNPVLIYFSLNGSDGMTVWKNQLRLKRKKDQIQRTYECIIKPHLKGQMLKQRE